MTCKGDEMISNYLLFFENLSYEINMYFKFRFSELLGNDINGLLPMKWGVNNEIMIIIGNNVFWKKFTC